MSDARRGLVNTLLIKTSSSIVGMVFLKLLIKRIPLGRPWLQGWLLDLL